MRNRRVVRRTETKMSFFPSSQSTVLQLDGMSLLTGEIVPDPIRMELTRHDLGFYVQLEYGGEARPKRRFTGVLHAADPQSKPPAPEVTTHSVTTTNGQSTATRRSKRE